jgi:hypothetical protein
MGTPTAPALPSVLPLNWQPTFKLATRECEFSSYLPAFPWSVFQAQRHLHPIRRTVRFAVLKRAKGRCEDCGQACTLELHHLTYYCPDGTLIFGHETRADLAALCRDCHVERHLDCNGEYCWDPEEAEASREA